MIAVWLVGPGQIDSDQDRRRGRDGYAGLRLADQTGQQPRVDVAQVGHPFGHQAAHPGEDGHELLDRSIERRQQRLAGIEVLANGGAEPPVGR